MKTKKNHFKVFALLISFFLNYVSFAQTQSFPANKTYSHGIMASNRNSDDAQSNYTIWKTNFLESCGSGKLRVKFDNSSQTVSEGVAYGMLLSAYSADRTTFDGLWNYYKSHTTSNGVMNWKINGCTGIIGNNGATDAEIDAAMALIVADFQWGSSGSINYNADAKTLIAAIKKHEVEAGTNILKPGDVFGGSNLTNASYFAPGYFRLFASFTADNFWISVADKCYDVINKNLTANKAVGGLVSDWCDGNGNYTDSARGYVNGGMKYTYDASRTPWRIATDYVWYGNADAKAYIKKASDFSRVTIGGTKNIVDGYNQDGTKSGRFHNATFVGAFACAAMGGDNQTHLDDSYADLNSTNEPNAYFNQTLKTIYLFLLSGNFYLPGTAPVVVTPTPVSSVSLSPATLNLTNGQTGNLSATVSPANATNKSVTYSSSNTSVATVNSSGLVTAVAVGSAVITVRTADGGKTATASVNVSAAPVVVVTSCAFGAPASAAIPSYNKITFSKMYVFGKGGPSAATFKKIQINWNQSKNSLSQFAYSTSNGVPAFYNDLRTKVTQNLNTSKPDISILNSGIPGLDGDYWVSAHNSNFVMVSKNNGYTLYFTNATTAPTCTATRNATDDSKPANSFAVYPSPTTGKITIVDSQNSFLRVIDLQGKVLLEKQTGSTENTELDLSDLNSGIYNIQIINDRYADSKRVVIQK